MNRRTLILLATLFPLLSGCFGAVAVGTGVGAVWGMTTYTTIPFFPGFLLASLAGFAAMIVFGFVVTKLGM